MNVVVHNTTNLKHDSTKAAFSIGKRQGLELVFFVCVRGRKTNSKLRD